MLLTSWVCKLLETGDDVNTKDSKGLTALMYAAIVGHSEMAQVSVRVENISFLSICIGVLVVKCGSVILGSVLKNALILFLMSRHCCLMEPQSMQQLIMGGQN